MKRLQLCLLALQFAVAAALCPPGYENLFGPKCYLIENTVRTYDEAVLNCEHKEGGKLASIHSHAEQVALFDALSPVTNYYIGLACNESNREIWYWSDGTAYDYDNAEGHSFRCPLMGSPVTVYLLSSTTANDAWIPVSSTAKYDLYSICEVPEHDDTRCPTSGYEYMQPESADPFCALAHQEATSWIDAEATCVREGAHLPSIHDLATNLYLRRTAVTNHFRSGFLIGFNVSSQGAAPQWVDGTDFDYTNFDTGMPNTFFGNCGAQLTTVLSGQWTSVFCDTRTELPYFCVQKVSSDAPKPCPTNNVYTGNGEITSPGYPDTASTNTECEYLLAVDSNFRVNISFPEFQLQDSDSITLYEGETDIIIAQITTLSSDQAFQTNSSSVMKLLFESSYLSGIRKWKARFAPTSS